MIWMVIAIISGVMHGVELVAVLPVIYLLARKNRDLALISFFLYSSLLPFQLNLSEIFSGETLEASLSLGIPSVMVLDEILRESEIRVRHLPFILLALLGFLNAFFLTLSVILLILSEMRPERVLRTLRSPPMIIFLLTLIIPSAVLWKIGALYFENQMALTGGAITAAFLLLQNAEKVDLFESSEKM
ncbi:MAG: hypothetical protein H5T47_00325 [Archaeoglobi archaeon]|nr:hypothetical protein [Candidatus Mnemosynella bozhongmuii]